MMKNLGGLAFISLMIGACGMDAENKTIPIIMIVVSLMVLFIFSQKAQK